KNVAGFDLTRLMIGAWGTLGVITQLHLRLRARPAVDRTMVLEAPPSAVDAVTAFGRGPYAPLALLAMDAGAAWTTMAGAIPAATDPSARRWMVRIGGNAPFVAAAQDALARLGRLTIVDGETVWSFVRQHAAPRSGPGPWRWDTLSTRLRDRFDPHRVLNRGLLDAV
ncbi:MAG: FAD-binding oxidoreductase, partial [Gemmatimonadaceae bacterium]